MGNPDRNKTINDVLNLFLIVSAVFLSGWATWNYFNQGWLAIQDYYLVGGALVLIFIRILNVVIKVNIVLFILLVAGAEILASYALEIDSESPVKRDYPIEDGLPSKYIDVDALIGYQGIPKVKVRSDSHVGERLLYDTVYTTDKLGRRETPFAAGGVRDKYVLFFGGSFTFGNGVADSETLPYYFATISEDYVPYNYGMGGYGPQHVLAKLENDKLRDEVIEKEGIAIYVFIDDHVLRAANTMRSRWVHRSPYYFLNEEGKITRNGNFNEARPVLYRLYHDILLSSRLLEILNVDFPLRINKNHIKLTAGIIRAAKREFKRQFNNDNFIVLMHPASNKVFGPRVKKLLKEEGVLVLELDDLMHWKKSYSIDREHDRHPNAEGNRALAVALNKAIINWPARQH